MTDINFVSARIRLLSMFLDHFFMCVVCVIFFLPLTIKRIASQTDLSEHQGFLYYLGLFGFSLYFCKDCINGRSMAKRILKLQVVDHSAGKVASPLKCLLRNIFCIAWMIEIFVVVASPNRRIGDRVARTQVVYYEPLVVEQLVEQQRVNFKEIALTIIIAYCLTLLIHVFFENKAPF